MMKSLFVLISLFILAGCQSTHYRLQSVDRGVTDQVYPDIQNASNRTIRYVSKLEAVKELCDNQSFRHNEQRAVVVIPASILKGSDENNTDALTFYHPGVAPFDMQQCVVEGVKSSWERIGSRLIAFGEKLITVGGKYALISKAIDKGAEIVRDSHGVKVNGDQNRIVGEGGVYDENPGIPVGEIQFEPFNLGVTNEESI